MQPDHPLTAEWPAPEATSGWIRRYAAAAGMALACCHASALELGRLILRPVAGPPVAAEIELRDSAPIDPASIRASIASPEAYALAGLDYHPALASLRIGAVRGAGGKVLLRIDGLPGDTANLDLLISAGDRVSLSMTEYHLALRDGPREVPAAPAGTALAARATVPGTRLDATTPEGADHAPSSLALEISRVHEALQAWALAASRRKADDYVAAYVPGFKGAARGSTHEQWARRQRKMILSRKNTSVEIRGLELTRRGSAMVATFVERQRSGAATRDLRKRMELVWAQGRWLIARESVLR
jgi:pilus assembly protein FimV